MREVTSERSVAGPPASAAASPAQARLSRLNVVISSLLVYRTSKDDDG